MALLDAEPPKPVTGLRKYVPLPFQIIILVLIAFFIGFHLWNYPEERAVARFLTTLEQGDYQKAYQLWQPSPSYSYNDFLHDWGEHGDYGKVMGFQILHSESKGSQTVLVRVRINGITPPLDLLVDRKSKGLAYSFY